jgi:glycosyltransferase involved in cell wall biosynthesis
MRMPTLRRAEPIMGAAITLVAHDVQRIGGMERQLSTLVTGALEAGIHVTLVSRTCELPDHPRLCWVRIRGPSRPFPIAYLWFFLAAGFALLRRPCRLLHTTGAIVPNRADVCTVHLCHRAIAGQKALIRARRASPTYRLNARLSSWMSRVTERLYYRPGRVRVLVGVSRGVTAEIRRYLPAIAGHLVTVPNGVDTTVFRPSRDERERQRNRNLLLPGDEPNVALFVGSEWEGKGLLPAIEAIARLRSWRLVVVGDGDVPRFQAHAERLGAGKRVHFLGRRIDTGSFFRAADAFILPSRYETFSLVTFEAAASGLPLLVTRVSGVEEILRDGENGWFI